MCICVLVGFFKKGPFQEVLSAFGVLVRRCFREITRVWVVVTLVLHLVVNLWTGSTSLKAPETDQYYAKNEISHNEHQTENPVPERETRTKVCTGLILELKSTLMRDVFLKNRNLACYGRVNNFQYFFVSYSR